MLDIWRGKFLKFSQRQGITPATKAIQLESIDIELKNSLWSLIIEFYWSRFNGTKFSMMERSDYIEVSNMNIFFLRLWMFYFKKPIDEVPVLFYDAVENIRHYFFEAKWYEVYDFIEFCSNNPIDKTSEKFAETCNKCLEYENSGYKFVNNNIVEISSLEEVSEIETAIETSTPFYGVDKHLTAALELMSDRKSPDFRNSIKESISAVESLCKKVTGRDCTTLGEALKVMEKDKYIHKALKNAFSSLYGYTNDAEGIRHAIMVESSLSKADARYMLISCSAFINYVISKHTKN